MELGQEMFLEKNVKNKSDADTQRWKMGHVTVYLEQNGGQETNRSEKPAVHSV